MGAHHSFFWALVGKGGRCVGKLPAAKNLARMWVRPLFPPVSVGGWPPPSSAYTLVGHSVALTVSLGGRLVARAVGL